MPDERVVSTQFYPGGVARSSAAEVIRFEAPDEVPRGPVALEELPPLKSPKHGWATLAALAIGTGLAAVGLGAWVTLAELRSDEVPVAPRPAVTDAVGVLADSQAERYPLRGSVERIVLVVAEDGRAALTLDGLGAAPAGQRYVAWVVPAGSATPLAAGTFDARQRVVPLERSVGRGTRVAVTLEPGSAVVRPSRPLRLSAVRE